jgi:hypothetical protein
MNETAQIYNIQLTIPSLSLNYTVLSLSPLASINTMTTFLYLLVLYPFNISNS